ncbi:MAG TPA: hypothetical protein VIM41_16610 [Gammaproteobacteria bacterium]
MLDHLSVANSLLKHYPCVAMTRTRAITSIAVFLMVTVPVKDIQSLPFQSL